MSHDPASGGQGLRPYDTASGGPGSARGPGRLWDVRPGTATHRAPEATRPRPAGPGRTSGGALHLDQPDAARPSEACATGCRPSREPPEPWEKLGRRSSESRRQHSPEPTTTNALTSAYSQTPT